MMRYGLIKKGLVLSVTLLFIGTGFFPTVLAKDIENNSVPIKGQATLYIDDDNCPGPGNGTMDNPFCKIQYGIDNATDGDIILVFNGTYCENVIVNKQVEIYGSCGNLVGNDTNGSIIDGMENGGVVVIADNRIKISDFTIQNSGNTSGIWYNSGILIEGSEDVNISGCDITNNNYGIYLNISSYNIDIFGNNIFNNSGTGISLVESSDINISQNNILNNDIGINLALSTFNVILNNHIYQNFDGIDIIASTNNFIINNEIFANAWAGISYEGIFYLRSNANYILYNEIYDNEYGIYLTYVYSDYIGYNKIYNNGVGIFLQQSHFNIISHNNISNNILYEIHLVASFLNTVINNNIDNMNRISLILSTLSITIAPINYWGTDNYIPEWPRKRISPIFAPILLFPWRNKAVEIPEYS